MQRKNQVVSLPKITAAVRRELALAGFDPSGIQKGSYKGFFGENVQLQS